MAEEWTPERLGRALYELALSDKDCPKRCEVKAACGIYICCDDFKWMMDKLNGTVGPLDEPVHKSHD